MREQSGKERKKKNNLKRAAYALSSELPKYLPEHGK